MRPGEISQYQLWTATLGTLLVAAFFSFPRAVVASTSTAAPWAIVLAGAVVCLLFLPTVHTLAQRTGQNLMDLALEGGGRPMAIALALVINLAISLSIGLSLRQSSELVVTALYPHTPQSFAMSAMIIVSALSAAMRPANAIWLASLYAWPTLVSILLLLVGNVGWGQLRNAMPITGHGIGPTLMELVPMTSYFSPLIHLVVFTSLLPSPRRLVRSTLLAIGASVSTWSLVILMFLMVFPLPAGLGIPFPLYEMSRLVQGGRFLERVDTIWIVVWAFGSALRTGLALLAGAFLFQQAFRLPDHRGAVLPLAIPTLAIALFPSNQADAVAMEDLMLRQVTYVLFFVFPLLVAMLARWRRKRSAAPGGGGSHA